MKSYIFCGNYKNKKGGEENLREVNKKRSRGLSRATKIAMFASLIATFYNVFAFYSAMKIVTVAPHWRFPSFLIGLSPWKTDIFFPSHILRFSFKKYFLTAQTLPEYKGLFYFLLSISIAMSIFISAAYSRGSSRTIGERNPLTIIVFAVSSSIPRLFI